MGFRPNFVISIITKSKIMNKLLITLLFAGLFFSCSTSKATLSNNEVPPVQNQDVRLHQTPDHSMNNIVGEWTLLGMDSFRPVSNDDKEPRLEPGDIIWNFSGERGMADTLYIMNYQADSKMPSGPQQYWTADCLVQIGNEIYSYQVFEIKDQKGNTYGRELVLDSNLDPSLPDGGMTYRFRSVDTFFACVVEDKEQKQEPERPQWASTLPADRIEQANVQYPKLGGNWQLSQMVAFADPSQLPNYTDGEGVWTFNPEGQSNQLAVKKPTTKINNDYSLAQGDYYFWMDQCVMKVGSDLYYYSIDYQTDKNGKEQPHRLTLQNDLSPSIADHTKFVFERMMD